MHPIRLYFLPLIIHSYLAIAMGKTDTFTFTNILCDSLPKTHIEFTDCDVSNYSQNQMALQIYTKLLVKKLDNIIMHAKFFRKLSTNYRPFLYDDVINFCKFQKNPNQNMFWNLIYRNVFVHSNINHSCPFEHDLIVKDLIYQKETINMIPFPRGQYMIRLQFFAHNNDVAKIEVYGTRK